VSVLYLVLFLISRYMW